MPSKMWCSNIILYLLRCTRELTQVRGRKWYGDIMLNLMWSPIRDDARIYSTRFKRDTSHLIPCVTGTLMRYCLCLYREHSYIECRRALEINKHEETWETNDKHRQCWSNANVQRKFTYTLVRVRRISPILYFTGKHQIR